MIGNEKALRDFNPHEASRKIDKNSLFRYKSREFTNLIEYIYYLMKENRVTCENVIEWLGNPDIIAIYENNEVYVYRWIFSYANTNELSATSFLCKSGRIISLAPEKCRDEIISNFDKLDKNNDKWLAELKKINENT